MALPLSQQHSDRSPLYVERSQSTPFFNREAVSIPQFIDSVSVGNSDSLVGRAVTWEEKSLNPHQTTFNVVEKLVFEICETKGINPKDVNKIIFASSTSLDKRSITEFSMDAPFDHNLSVEEQDTMLADDLARKLGLNEDIAHKTILAGCTSSATAMVDALANSEEGTNVLVISADAFAGSWDPDRVDDFSKGTFTNGVAAAIFNVGRDIALNYDNTNALKGFVSDTLQKNDVPHQILPDGSVRVNNSYETVSAKTHFKHLLGDADTLINETLLATRYRDKDGSELHVDVKHTANFVAKLMKGIGTLLSQKSFQDMLSSEIGNLVPMIGHQPSVSLIDKLKSRLSKDGINYVDAGLNGNPGAASVLTALLKALKSGEVNTSQEFILLGYGPTLISGGVLRLNRDINK